MPDTCTVAVDDIAAVAAVFTLAVAACGPAAGQVPGFAAAAEACERMLAAARGAQLPRDPVSSVKSMAITHHQMMLDYEEAGFDHSEALAFAVNYAQAFAMAAAQAAVMRAVHG